MLDSGFYPNWRDYFVEASPDPARAGLQRGRRGEKHQPVGRRQRPARHGDRRDNHRLQVVDETNKGAGGRAMPPEPPGTYWVPGVAPEPRSSRSRCASRSDARAARSTPASAHHQPEEGEPGPADRSTKAGRPRWTATGRRPQAAIKARVIVVASAGNEETPAMGFPGANEPVVPRVGSGAWPGF